MRAPDLGTTENPLRVAVVGSGPAGFYAAAALLDREQPAVEVDIFERLPTPYGLVRGGVAPDHQNIKQVIDVYEQIARDSRLRFIGNVELGRDLTADQLRRHYHQLVYAVGNEAGRRLGIPGEGLPGSLPAEVFVGWYNGHPDYARLSLATPLQAVRRAVVIGNGNVALDVARILARRPEELAPTDVAGEALAALHRSRVQEIEIIGRRGPAQASFTAPELKAIAELRGVRALAERTEIQLDRDSTAELARARRGQRRAVDLLRGFADAAPDDADDVVRRVRFRFLLAPREIIAGADGAVRGVRCERTTLQRTADGPPRAVGTGEQLQLDAELVITAVGFRGKPLPGVPFDDDRRVIRNLGGRVVDADGAVVPGEYVVGWARSGASGVIGAHRRASAEVVALMLRDVAAGHVATAAPSPAQQLLAELAGRRVLFSFADWKTLDRIENERGRRRGAIRDKLTSVAGMIAARGEPGESG